MLSKTILLARFNIHDQYKASKKHLLKIKHTDLGTVLALTKTSSQQGEFSPIRVPDHSNWRTHRLFELPTGHNLKLQLDHFLRQQQNFRVCLSGPQEEKPHFSGHFSPYQYKQHSNHTYSIHLKSRAFSTEILKLGSSLPPAIQQTPCRAGTLTVPPSYQHLCCLPKKQGMLCREAKQALPPSNCKIWQCHWTIQAGGKMGFSLSRKPLKEEPEQTCRLKDRTQQLRKQLPAYVLNIWFAPCVSRHTANPDSSHRHNINSTSEVQTVQPNLGEYRVTKRDLPAKPNCTGTSLVIQCKAKIQLLQH